MAFYIGNTRVTPILKSSTGEWGTIQGDIKDQLDLQEELDSKQDSLVAGSGISIDVDSEGNSVISNTQTSAEWGNIEGNISDQADLKSALDSKLETESDPTVPAWAKANTKPSYTASEVGALPDTTVIPDKTSQLTNDSGYLDSIVVDLGEFDVEDYDGDYWNFIATITETGFYKATEYQDGFGFFIRVERTDNCIYQEYWYDEENSLIRNCRSGYLNGDEWEFNEPTTLATDSEVDDILNNNYYTMDQVDEMFEDFHPTAETMIETTWANLVSLRDNAQLVRGAWYRITDYEFITTAVGFRSAGHRFDIVLLAISESMLSESGYACKHAGDRYFEREITVGGIEWLYTMYADDYTAEYGDEPIDHADDIHSVDQFCASDVMTHPGTGDDVPVLFKTNVDEYGLDDPDYEDAFFYEGTYDFDGDEYDMWAKYEYSYDDEEWVFMQQYALTPIVVENGELTVSPIPETKTVPVNMNAWELKYCLDNDKELFSWAATEGRGVIYYLKDEFGNEAPYDFKNVQFERRNITSAEPTVSQLMTGEYSRLGKDGNYAVTCGTTRYYYYTFDTPYNAGNDSSLFGDSAYNVIKPYILEGKRQINDIVLGFANNNTIGSNCFDLTIWGAVQNNNLKHACTNILCIGMTGVTAESMRTSTFCQIGSTTFGNGSWNNIGNQFSDSDIGRGCYNNDFGVGNSGLKIGNSFQGNRFGSYCYSDSFDNGVSNCTFGNYVSYNDFGKSVTVITLPNYTRYCKFETGASRITFNTYGGGYSSYIQYVTVGRGVSNLTAAPSRARAYEQIYYGTGRIETAV